MRKHPLLLACLLPLAVFAQNTQHPKPVLLPSKFIHGERFYIKLATASKDTLLGFGDTGGGFTAIYPDVLDSLKLTPYIKQTVVDSMPFSYIAFSDVVKDPHIPAMALSPSSPIPMPVFDIPSKEIMMGEMSFVRRLIPQDAFLGQFFFVGKAWTFDYPHQQIWVNTAIPLADSGAAHVVRLGFKKNAAGQKLFGHPSMQIKIDGETIDVLFDSGASLLLSTNGKQALNTTEGALGGSFIAKSIFDVWHTKHPDWKTVDKGEITGASLILVPAVTIGNQTVGPVWFAVRPDAAWSVGMIRSMDKIVHGAIGGSAFKYLKVTIDYNHELARFEKAE